MSFDLVEVLGRMWKIGWNHKVLWLYQIMPGLLFIILLPLFFLVNPAVLKLLPPPWNRYADESWLFVLSMAVIFIAIIPIMFLNVAAHTATTHGAVKVERGAERLACREVFRESLPFFWRVFGLYFMFGAAWMVIGLAFIALSVVAIVLTFGLAMFCIMPLFFLTYPVAMVGYIVLELARAAVVADDMHIMEAVSHGWRLFRANIIGLTVLMLILYFGLSMITSFIMFPMMAPMMPFPFSLDASGDINAPFFILFLVLFIIMFVVMFIVQGVLMAFFQSAWAAAYVRLSRGKNAPVIVEANA